MIALVAAYTTIPAAAGGAAGGAAGAFFLLVILAIAVGVVAGMWKVFEKAGQPGWGALIPIYNAYLLVKVAGRPGWWLILYVVPVLSLIPAVIIPFDVAKNFERGTLFAIGLMFLPFIFYPYLGWSDARYNPPVRPSDPESGAAQPS